MGIVSRLLKKFATSTDVAESDVAIDSVVISWEGATTALKFDAKLIVSHPEDVYAYNSFLSIF